MKPGRKPIPRAERLVRGLPVCAVEWCDRTPIRRGQCRTHYTPDPARRGDVGPNPKFLRFEVPPELADAVRRAAARDGVTQALWVRHALVRALAVMVATPPEQK